MFYDAAVNGYVSKIKHFSHNAREYLVFFFLLSVNLGIYGVIFNLYVLRLGYKEDLLGLMLCIVYLSTGIASLPTAMLCDRIGRKATLIISSITIAIALLLLYTVTTKEMLLAASILYGIGTAFYTIAGSPFLVENSTADERMHLFSVSAALSQVAYIVGCLAGGAMPLLLVKMGMTPSGPLTYRYTLFLSLAAVVITLVPLLYIKETGRRQSGTRRMIVLGKTLRSRKVQQLIIINGLVGIGAGMIVPFFNVYFHNVLSSTTDQIGLIFSVAEGVMVVGLMALPFFTERFGKIKTIALTELASIPFLIMLAFTTNVFVAAFAYTMRMTLMNMANPAINNFNMEIVREDQRATVSSLTTMSWYFCQSISAYLSGIMMAGSNYVLPFMVTCVTYLASSSLYYIFFMKVEREMTLKVEAISKKN